MAILLPPSSDSTRMELMSGVLRNVATPISRTRFPNLGRFREQTASVRTFSLTCTHIQSFTLTRVFFPELFWKTCLKPKVPWIVQWAWIALFCKQVV